LGSSPSGRNMRPQSFLPDEIPVSNPLAAAPLVHLQMNEPAALRFHDPPDDIAVTPCIGRGPGGSREDMSGSESVASPTARSTASSDDRWMSGAPPTSRRPPRLGSLVGEPGDALVHDIALELVLAWLRRDRDLDGHAARVSGSTRSTGLRGHHPERASRAPRHPASDSHRIGPPPLGTRRDRWCW